ncbi:MAG TPA: hypothetical protein VJU84_08745 [Pyrinomonadaceae bacterium]|nr:hypothetical protein [Pyrinomonadaceae bacterium]
MGKHVNRSRDPFWEPEEPPRAKSDSPYQKGIFKAQPAHFSQPWPTVRTETFVQMVFGCIKKNERISQPRIIDETGLDEDTVGTTIADLLLWRKQIGSEVVEVDGREVRQYFVKSGARL